MPLFPEPLHRYPHENWRAFDLEMRHALTRALAGCDGSLVLVSHDRALLRTVCDRFLLVADRRVTEFDGDLDDYLGWLADSALYASTEGARIADYIKRQAELARLIDAAEHRSLEVHGELEEIGEV